MRQLVSGLPGSTRQVAASSPWATLHALLPPAASLSPCLSEHAEPSLPPPPVPLLRRCACSATCPRATSWRRRLRACTTACRWSTAWSASCATCSRRSRRCARAGCMVSLAAAPGSAMPVRVASACAPHAHPASAKAHQQVAAAPRRPLIPAFPPTPHIAKRRLRMCWAQRTSSTAGGSPRPARTRQRAPPSLQRSSPSMLRPLPLPPPPPPPWPLRERSPAAHSRSTACQV